MSKKKVTFFNIAAILSISLMYMAAGSLIAPALNALQVSFPDTPFPTIRYIMTSMYIAIAIFSLVSGVLASKISKKFLAALGLLIYGVTGVIGYFLNDVTALIIIRLLMGVGVGLFLPQATAIIVDTFTGEKREKLLGYSTGIANLGSMIGSLVGGYLANIDWRLNFLAFGFALVIFVIVVIGVPGKQSSTSEAEQSSVSSDMPKKKVRFSELPPFLIVLVIGMFLVQVYALVTPTNMARFYLATLHADPNFLGTTMALLTGFAFIAGFVVVYVMKIFNAYTAFVACVLTSIGFFLLANSDGMVMAMISNSLIGFANGILMPCIFIKNSQIVTPEQRQITLSILSAALYLGCFATSYVQTWISAAIGSNSLTDMFMAFGALAIVASIIVLICTIVFQIRRTRSSASVEPNSAED